MPIGLLISVLGSGSGGNATFVSNGRTQLLIDAGLACRDLETRLRSIGVRPGGIDAVLLSHEHHDHVRGVLRFAHKHRVPIYATEGTHRWVRRQVHPKTDWLRIKAHQSQKIGRIVIEVAPTPHDAVEPVAFRLTHGRLVFAHVTDIGHVSRAVEELLEGSHVALVESNHDVEMLRRGPYPEPVKFRVAGSLGHLSNEQLARYLQSKLPDTVRHLILAHLSQTNNHESLAYFTARRALETRGGRLPAIHLSRQDRPTRLLRVGEARCATSDECQGVLSFQLEAETTRGKSC